MSCRGIYQLKNITLLFCDWGGFYNKILKFINLKIKQRKFKRNKRTITIGFIKRIY